jgi:glycine cleavage system H lipoate-binding protein
MTCPFLREAQVKFCEAAPVRKLIPMLQCGRAEEKCSSGAHTTCRVFQGREEQASTAPAGHCPFLGESLMQYCGAAPVARFVPYSESVLSRCGNEGFRYCELYLSMAHPASPADEVDGIAVPDWLRYASNHTWLDITSDGTCHAGVDAFLSRVIGPVERISYVWMKGDHRPAAILTAGGIDLEVVFPNPIRITGCNLYLRANPTRISTEPYTAGWLFEGTPLPETAAGLLEAGEARAWMGQEERRMNQCLQDAAGTCAADGGLCAPGALRLLSRERAMALFHEFFSPLGRDEFRESNRKRESL